MSSPPASSGSMLVEILGDFRWVRAHVSMFAVGAVLLVSVNLLIGSASLWSLTAIGIWSMLLIVHLVVLAIARLSTQLDSEDDEEIVLLPVQDAVIVDPSITPDPTTTWTNAKPADTAGSESDAVEHPETVSWQVATDLAQARRGKFDAEESEPT